MYDDELQHHGVPGQKWGVRRYQNEDGSLNSSGQKKIQKYNKNIAKYQKKSDKARKKLVVSILQHLVLLELESIREKLCTMRVE